ncbi:MAG TPA: adenylate/guanylate cyclase domain-containing protein [Thermoguttaceae bacterium]|nr:adenylate/guanylate cyclase domain-containing protein [Thermoguttaceae bacterium]
MPDLIAQGVEAQQRWRRALPQRQPVELGRAAGVWAVPWDHHISRHHVRVLWTGSRLEVTRLEGARNPVFLNGKEQTRFALEPGEHFVIGQTTFTLADQRVSITADVPEPVKQQSYSAQYLKQVKFRNPDHRIEVLSRLPEVISGATGDAELFVRLVSMLLAGIPRADAAAVVAAVSVTPAVPDKEPATGVCDGELPDGISEDEQGEGMQRNDRKAESPADSRPPVRMLHWDQRLAVGSSFQPSQRLILEATRQQQSVMHVWRGAEANDSQVFTESDNFDWAFCTPVLGKSCAGWGLYIAGRFNVERSGTAATSDPADLREDVKFTELVAAMLSSLRQMRLLEHQHASLSQFFSPVVLETLAAADPEVVLKPQETEVSVLFCDLRGFARETERHADNLIRLLNRVSEALGVMTHHIRQQGGVVGDFHGDAAMGFWGWPLPQEDAVARTCRAALAIRAKFEATARLPDSPLTGFLAGIGVATGRAVAGKIGTEDQVKVSVFGPVVNLASRLEGMTKILRAPILIDQATAEAVREHVPGDVARVRRLAVVRPYGMDGKIEVSELLPPAREYPKLTDEHLRFYESALDAFLSGRWPAALEWLQKIPSEDQVKDFLTVYIAQHNRVPPPDWDGVIPLESK